MKTILLFVMCILLPMQTSYFLKKESDSLIELTPYKYKDVLTDKEMAIADINQFDFKYNRMANQIWKNFLNEEKKNKMYEAGRVLATISFYYDINTGEVISCRLIIGKKLYDLLSEDDFREIAEGYMKMKFDPEDIEYNKEKYTSGYSSYLMPIIRKNLDW